MSWLDDKKTQKKFRKLQKKRRTQKNIGKYILIIIIFLTVGYFIWWNTTHISDDNYSDMISGLDSDIQMNGYCYHYRQLTDSQKHVYQMLYKSSLVYSGDVLINYTSEADCKRAMFAFRYDHPEFFWIGDGKYYKNEGKVERITLEIPKDVETQKNAIDMVTEAVLKDAPNDPYEKVKYIYESIILSTDYQKGTENEQDIRSVLLSHKSVCGGYSKTFLYLCDKADIPCGYVIGDIDGMDLHAWNFVVLDDKSYWVDVTWGDPTYEFFVPTVADGISYDYLCVEDGFLLTNRILSNNPACSVYDIDTVFEYPTCPERLLWQ